MSQYTIAAVSCGKDSLVIPHECIRRGKRLDEVVMYDTAMEFQAIYDTWAELTKVLDAYGIKHTVLHPEYDFYWKMFEKPVITEKERTCERCIHCKPLSMSWSYCDNPESKFYKKHDEDMGGMPTAQKSKASCKHLELIKYTKYGYSWCGGVCRWGTTDKNTTMDRYAEERDAIVLVGIAADEKWRLEKEIKPYKRHPLIDWDMTEADCLAHSYELGYEWREHGAATPDGTIRLYDILARVSCWCCANKNIDELRNIYHYLPQYWERLKDLQRRTCRPMKSRGQSVFDLERRYQLEDERTAAGLSIKNREFFQLLNERAEKEAVV